ncbi:hypothetical protein [Shewanella psychropiezotolerans]|uniref:hypothetical protein n=1 Tax=Shewanella psychropiezotolerans TaxID=2593655 RepID=UPI001E5FA28B|nr:hypothetical protein [Shewanella psychropiezotolerans]
MGQVDIEKEHPYVTKMKILGCKLVSVTKVFPKDYFYVIGSVVGPHPFSKMVRDFQSIIGHEVRELFQQKFKKFSNHHCLCRR